MKQSPNPRLSLWNRLSSPILAWIGWTLFRLMNLTLRGTIGSGSEATISANVGVGSIHLLRQPL